MLIEDMLGFSSFYIRPTESKHFVNWRVSEVSFVKDSLLHILVRLLI